MGLNWIGIDVVKPYLHDQMNHVYKITEVKRVPRPGSIKQSDPRDSTPRPHHQGRPEQNDKNRIPAKRFMETHVTTVTSDQKPSSVLEMMRETHFHHFPVVDTRRRIIGIVSDRDLLRGKPSPQHSEAPLSEDTIESVQDIMSTKVLVASPETDVQDIGLCMLNERIDSIPIVDRDHHILGIITTTNLLSCLIRHGHQDCLS